MPAWVGRLSGTDRVNLISCALRASSVQGEVLFVYGTLRAGEEAAHKMDGAAFLGRAETAPECGLVDVGDGYAGMVPGDKSVCGELYLVGPEKMAELDEWEERFTRKMVPLSDGSEAWAYFFDG